ncbi:FkbM family methyltransferase [Alteribacillus sp. YIM 98480]|uniref:FkbM family methyltransferase n=1 Tax=Alteribacillus sp. YIM 98480 TaxID=2606599 RepID=UPI00131BF66E|nr:FkbM family methyltransferase [Alteribacillus sp. YIM 98480]
MKKVLISGCNNVIYVDENDKKGKDLIRTNGFSQPRVVNFWRRAVKKLNPTVVFDVGLNYGEVLFSTQYHPKTVITGIEANSKLSPYINQTLTKHPNGDQIKIIYALASDKNSKFRNFYINQRSGDSSVFSTGVRPQKKVKVNSVKIDQLFSQRSFAKDTLLFKIDVEGYEWNVLKGMLNTLKTCNGSAGCIEFNIAYLERVGINVEQFLRFLDKKFYVYPIGRDNNLIKIKSLNLENVKKYFASDKRCNDLVLLSNKTLINKLGLDVKLTDL